MQDRSTFDGGSVPLFSDESDCKAPEPILKNQSGPFPGVIPAKNDKNDRAPCLLRIQRFPLTETKQNKERDEVLKRMLKMKPKPHVAPKGNAPKDSEPTVKKLPRLKKGGMVALIGLVGIIYVGLKSDIDDLKKDVKEVVKQEVETRVDIVKAIAAVEKQSASTNARLDQLIQDGRQNRR